MVTLGFKKRSALVQIPLLLGFLIMAVAVPVATKLVQQNQDTRNQAAGCGSSGTISQCGSKGGCATGYRCLPNGCSYDPACGGFVPTNTPKPPTSAPTKPPTSAPTKRPTYTCNSLGGSCVSYGCTCGIVSGVPVRERMNAVNLVLQRLKVPTKIPTNTPAPPLLPHGL